MRKNLPTVLVNELCEHCPEDHYCILKELCVQCALLDDRFMIQMKCIEIFKYEEGKRQQKHIDWNEASFLWVDRGYAKRFAEVYDEIVQSGKDIHLRPTYRTVVQ